MISLSCLPCGDSKECIETSVTRIAAVENHDHNNHETENCTPFCSCACCAVPVHIQQPIYSKAPAISFQSFDFQYSDDFRSYNSHAIWQPPRLG